MATVFFKYDTKSTSNKSKNKRNYIKIKSFRTAKETINKMKRQSTEWEKIFENHLYDIFLKYIRNSYNSRAIKKKKSGKRRTLPNTIHKNKLKMD